MKRIYENETLKKILPMCGNCLRETGDQAQVEIYHRQYTVTRLPGNRLVAIEN